MYFAPYDFNAHEKGTLDIGSNRCVTETVPLCDCPPQILTIQHKNPDRERHTIQLLNLHACHRNIDQARPPLIRTSPLALRINSVDRTAYNGDGLIVVDGQTGKCLGSGLIVQSMKVIHMRMCTCDSDRFWPNQSKQSSPLSIQQHINTVFESMCAASKWCCLNWCRNYEHLDPHLYNMTSSHVRRVPERPGAGGTR